MNLGIIGAGNMGEKHARIISQIGSGINLYIVDIDIKRGSEIAKKYNGKYFSSYKQIIKNYILDAVIVASSTKTHYKIGKYFIKKRIPTFIEKPIAMKVWEGERLIQIAKNNKTLLMIGHIERFNPAIQKVKEIVQSGNLGGIIAISARRIGGFPPQITDMNIGVDLAIHDIDICNYLLEELPRKVLVNNQRNHIKRRDDSVEFFLKYKKASAYIQANWISPVKIRILTITGTEGYLEMNYITQKIELYKSKYTKFKKNIGEFSDFILRFSTPDKEVVPIEQKEPLMEEMKYFLDLVKNKKVINSEYALDALRIATKIK